jgi:hypothetical protein
VRSWDPEALLFLFTDWFGGNSLLDVLDAEEGCFLDILISFGASTCK